jgi:molybdopterin-guanine dinucleotide biosynthesis protein A
MGRDKAFLEIDGVPLWRRQLSVLEAMKPAQLMIAGPPRPDWNDTGAVIVPDRREHAGPLAGIAAGLRRCSTELLLVLAVDLPNITTGYLRALLEQCSHGVGVVPQNGDRFEPVAALYPTRSASVVERLLGEERPSLQRFARECVDAHLVRTVAVSAVDALLLLNMNTPSDLVTASIEHRVG